MLDTNILYVICPENGEEDPDFTYDFDEATRRVKEYRAKGDAATWKRPRKNSFRSPR